MSQNPPLQAMVFDLDGLMADSEPLALWAWNQTLERFGHRLDDETLRDGLGMRVIDSARVICQRFSLPISPEQAMAEENRLFLEAVPTRLRACAGLYPLLDELTARGVPLAIGTSGHRRYVALALRTLGIEGRFQAVVTGDEVARGKPAPDTYLMVAQRLDVPPERCLVLEDAPLGVESACAAGMICAAVPNQWTASLDFPGAYRVFASLNEVVEALDDLFGNEDAPSEDQPVRYTAAGGVVVSDGRVLVLRRACPPSVPPIGGEEVRLPKGHVEPGEEVEATALREIREESGYDGLKVNADLGAQLVEFEHKGRHVVRTERYFLMTLTDGQESALVDGEEQFEPVWLTWDRALAALTFAAEREWVRRARLALSPSTWLRAGSVEGAALKASR